MELESAMVRFAILPRLEPGVSAHFHDLAIEYPRNWAVDENRSWNELYALDRAGCRDRPLSPGSRGRGSPPTKQASASAPAPHTARRTRRAGAGKFSSLQRLEKSQNANGIPKLLLEASSRKYPLCNPTRRFVESRPRRRAPPIWPNRQIGLCRARDSARGNECR
jgi:hypothetical protein